MSVFKAYDIRGVFGQGLTLDLTYQVGLALAQQLKDKQLALEMAVGRDGRDSSKPLFDALSKGLTHAGVKVKDVGVCPTPLLYFAAYTQVHGNGVMITGSHNPPQYNGLKITLGSAPFFGEELKALETKIHLFSATHAQHPATIETLQIKKTYLDRITSDVKISRPLKLVVDAGNGVAGLIAPDVYRAMGCEVVELFCDVDARFPNHHPDPADPHNLQDLIAKVQETKADLGFAFDGDGDRLGVATPSGEIIYPDRQLMLFIQDILKNTVHDSAQKTPIVFDVKCSSFVPQIIRECGGEPVMYKTGHSWIKTHMKKIGAPIGGEMSGHIFFAHRWYGFDDAIYSGARLLEIVSRAAQPAKMLEALPKGFSTPELKWELEIEGAQHQLVQRLQQHVAQHPECLLQHAQLSEGHIQTIDGVRVDFKQGFGLVRASNTTPTVILRFEGNTQAALNTIMGQFKHVLIELEPGAQLPI